MDAPVRGVQLERRTENAFPKDPFGGADNPLTIPITALWPSDSPRSSGVNTDHVRTLAELEVTALPPILVHRATMRVIDGMHRLRAAELRGADQLAVRFFDGGEADAFVIGVRANVTHGLPLSLADRRMAALRIIASHPDWSDRAIASATGLAAKTVGEIRRRASADVPQSLSRVGRDGRVRPLNAAEGRLRASAMMRAHPSMSLRQIGSAAGVSLATVRDVRDRISRGEDPVPLRQRRARSAVVPGPRRSGKAEEKADDRATLLARLKQDPSIRFSAAGRMLIRLLCAHSLGQEERKQIVETVPAHCRGIVAELAYACGRAWLALGDQFVQRTSTGE